MAQDAIGKLTAALQRHLQKEAGDGLYIASMDHSPSEQLAGALWHTTVLVLSRGLEHAALAQNLAKRLRHRTGTLGKWRTATPKIRLGPFVRASTGETSDLVLSQNRAAMCLFVAHFVLRMHRHMYDAANIDRPSDPGHINWNFFGDKFPGPPGDDMDLMFQILVGLDRGTGRILWGYFRESDTVETDLLADNLAGALNDIAVRQEPRLSFREGSAGLFYWERWS